MYIYYNEDGQITMTSDHFIKSGQDLGGIMLQTYDHYIEVEDDLGDKFMHNHKVKDDHLVDEEGKKVKLTVKKNV